MQYLLKLSAASAALALAFAPSASAQIVGEVAAMTVSSEIFDGDLLAAQPTVVSVSDVNNATLSGNSLNLADVILTPSTAALGVQSTNVFGAALALDPAGSGSMMSANIGESFQAFNAQLDLSGPSTEIGLAIADWVGPMILDFYSGGVLQYSHTSSSYQNNGVEDWLYFQMTGGTFDRVDFRASTTGGNWAIAGMEIEATGPPAPALGLTCATGLVTANISNCTPGGPIAIAYGPAAPYVHAGNTCNGIALDLTPAAAPIVVFADAAGAATVQQQVNPLTCGSGILVQAADIVTCVATNSSAL